MKHTTLHSNSLLVLGVGTLAAMVMAVTGHECLGGNIFAGSIGLALRLREAQRERRLRRRVCGRLTVRQGQVHRTPPARSKSIQPASFSVGCSFYLCPFTPLTGSIQ